MKSTYFEKLMILIFQISKIPFSLNKRIKLTHEKAST